MILPCPTPLLSFAIERSLGKVNSRSARRDSIAETSNDAPLPAFVVAHDFRGLPREDKHERGRPAGVRPISNVVGLTWHCTASGELDEDHPNLEGIPAGLLIHRSGAVTLLGNFTDYMEHGHALNGGTFGIEVDCRPARIEGDPRTFWRSKEEETGWRTYDDGRPPKFVGIKTYDDLVCEATHAQLEVIPVVMRWCMSEVARLGGKPGVRANWAHRQGHWSRTGDPGERVWTAVRSAGARLGLADVEHRTLGSGNPIDDWRAPRRS